ncbi:uncharacterized protein LOC129968600 isoform X2 [Argiope bruennichi]|uniref:uncharacterized protein LOC129968600 isoform X2 n=1 Tax=Argiope bruennichi TaxID=94029 RepID=UPI00249550B6|nr:uncharacterized protein LOC129968600 isoform X2 [Argiope bruennichi]
MQLLFLLAAGVLVGSVSCDVECFKSVFRDCQLNAVDDCDQLKAVYECAAQKATECSMEFADPARNVIRALEEVCTEASPLRTRFLRQKECYTEALDNENCFYLIYNLSSYIETSQDFIKMNKEGCRNLNVYSKCVVKNVKKNCGDLSTFTYLLDPLMRLGQGLCKEVILPADENDKASDNLGLLSIFSITVLSFYHI